MQAKFVSPDIKHTRPLEEGFVGKSKDEKSLHKNKNDTQNYKEDSLDIVSAVFKKQPPDNLRKSNFFHFDLSFYDTCGNEVLIEKATFIGFQEDRPDERPLRNGIKYRLHFCLPDAKKQTEELLVRLIDSSSKKPISYDGQDKNPDMCRVLLTHEVMCSRCCESKSCGNRNETPSDPVIMNNGLVSRYHMKCNQNCLKNAGNPRETRRFQVIIEFLRSNEIVPLVTSENMFVHNNSKHGRRLTALCDSSLSCSSNGDNISSKLPMIHQIIPKEGKLSGCDEIAIVGESFFEGIQVAFGNQIAYKTEVITPPCNGSLAVEIKCVHGCRILFRGIAPQFRYNTELYDNQIDFFIERLWALLPKQAADIEKPTRDIILRRTIEVFEYLYTSIQPSNPIQNIAQNGKDQKAINIQKNSSQSDAVVDQLANNNEYIRQALLNNNHNAYDNINGNQGYIMGQVLVGMNQMCDPLTVNTQQNFFVPYPGVCDSAQLGMNVNFPIKRPYPGIQ
ncbi:hypothetical protein MXB_523 [Myxobolus squamalis]|nr:hypothetical protein MXB_523 [Myxobolus squamalis]